MENTNWFIGEITSVANVMATIELTNLGVSAQILESGGY
jgi:hypothetical protein